MGENIIIEQQRSDKNYRTTKKVRSKFRYVFFFLTPSEENRIIEQQGTVNNRTFVLLNFRYIIPALTIMGNPLNHAFQPMFHGLFLEYLAYQDVGKPPRSRVWVPSWHLHSTARRASRK